VVSLRANSSRYITASFVLIMLIGQMMLFFVFSSFEELCIIGPNCWLQRLEYIYCLGTPDGKDVSVCRLQI